MVHEYLNDTWRTFYVTEVAEALSEAALGFLASADPLENAAEYYVTPETKELIDAAPDRLMAEFLKDLACNQWYRRDLFIRGTRQLTTEGKEEQIEQFSFVAVAQASVSSEIFQTMLGDAKVPLESWSPIVNFLGATPRTFGEIVDATGQDPESVLQALAALVSGGVVHPVLPTVDVAAAKRFNRVVANRTRLGEPYRHIAYPRAGTAFPAEDVESNALTLIQDGEARDVESLKNALWTIFGARGRHAIRFGGVLQHMDVTFDDLAAWARHIWEHRVPVWRSQGLLQGDGDSVG
jgi:hypothetical protein